MISHFLQYFCFVHFFLATLTSALPLNDFDPREVKVISPNSIDNLNELDTNSTLIATSTLTSIPPASTTVTFSSPPLNGIPKSTPTSVHPIVSTEFGNWIGNTDSIGIGKYSFFLLYFLEKNQ